MAIIDTENSRRLRADRGCAVTRHPNGSVTIHRRGHVVALDVAAAAELGDLLAHWAHEDAQRRQLRPVPKGLLRGAR